MIRSSRGSAESEMSSIIAGKRTSYLLDTNVISETRKIRPNARVMQFIGSVGRPVLYISVLSFGELERGVIQLRERDSLGAAKLLQWLEELQILFRGRTLPIDLQTARLCGALSSDRSRPPVDTLLAGTAFAHSLIFVTRNTRDVSGLPIAVLNPWEM